METTTSLSILRVLEEKIKGPRRRTVPTKNSNNPGNAINQIIRLVIIVIKKNVIFSVIVHARRKKRKC